MPTIFSHPAVPLAIYAGLGTRVVPARLLAAGVVASVLPDFDVLALRLDIGYSMLLGHRGITHSLAFACALAAFAWIFAAQLRATPRTAFLFVLAAAASHGLLDMLTNGGSGIALLWPFSSERLFFPVRVIEVSPISLGRFIDAAGRVLGSELRWVWLPCALAALVLRGLRMRSGREARATR